MAKYSKEQAIKIITSAAEKYKNELVNKTLLFVCADKHKHIEFYEFSFYNWNFMHLTGVETKVTDEEMDDHLSAINFYNKCLSHKLSQNDFDFSEDGTTHMKLDVISSMLCKNLTAKMIGTYNSNKPYLYTDKIAGSVKACIGFVVDSTKNCYVPNTLLKDDIRHNVYSYVQVIATFRKAVSEHKYSELTYRANKIDWKKTRLPKEIDYLSSHLK